MGSLNLLKFDLSSGFGPVGVPVWVALHCHLVKSLLQHLLTQRGAHRQAQLCQAATGLTIVLCASALLPAVLLPARFAPVLLL